MADFEIVVSPLQPEGIIVKNADDAQDALKKFLHFCWVIYPGFFLDHRQEGTELTYHGKFVTSGYPMMQEVQWQ